MNEHNENGAGSARASGTVSNGRMATLGAIILAAIVLLFLATSGVNGPLPANQADLEGGPEDASAMQARKADSPRLEIRTQLGSLVIELYPDQAPRTVTRLLELVRDGYYDSDTYMETRPQLGFVIAKLGESLISFKPVDEVNGLSSKRGSVAISRPQASSAYLNNLFFGYGNQPELEKHYIIIGQVLEGLDQIEHSSPGLRYRVNEVRIHGLGQADVGGRDTLG